jgi:hypothetical protein
MKLSVRLGLILFVIGLPILGNMEVWGADWKVYSTNDETVYSYDRQGLSWTSKNIVRVWVKWEYTDIGIMRVVQQLGKEYENFKYIIALDEINCSDKKSRNLSLAYYSKYGEALYTDSSGTDWDYIVPQSILESLHEAVCK